MLRFGKTKEEFYDAKKPVNIWDVNVDNGFISNLIETKNNTKYLIGYLDDVMRPFPVTFVNFCFMMFRQERISRYCDPLLKNFQL